KQENKAIHFVWVYIFLLYIYLTFSVAGIGSIWDIGHYDTIIRLEEINLLPFQSEGIMTYVLNIIMFLPLGFLIPLIWKRYRNPLKIFMIGFGFSLSIELCQLFNRRNTDIDDLMMNTLGAVIGYFIWKWTKRLFKNINHKSISLSKLEPIVYLTLAVLGEFLLFNWRIFL
ncbi:VanZ family protein, partial [[Ruminococcus] torques]|uniref:VanZ family protein n=1 Tax=[Ruminococcus] torques TaxID=33039 RepID=UPI00241FBEB8